MFHITGGWKVGYAATLPGGDAKIILVFVPLWKTLLKSNSRFKTSRKHLSCDPFPPEITKFRIKGLFFGTENIVEKSVT